MRLKFLTLAAVGAIAIGQSLAVAADTNPQPIDFTRNVMDAPAPVAGAIFGTGPAVTTGTAICTTASQTVNANTDCETTSTGPHNETSIAVNPTNPSNMIGGANDYQLTLNPDGHLTETILSRAHVTFEAARRGRCTPCSPTPPTRRPATPRWRLTRLGPRTTPPWASVSSVLTS